MQSVSAMTLNYNSRQPESLCTRVHSAPREEGCEALPLELTSNLKKLKRLVFKKRLYPEISKDPKTLFSLSNRRAVNIARVQNWHSLLHGVNGERSLFETKMSKVKTSGLRFFREICREKKSAKILKRRLLYEKTERELQKGSSIF